MPVWRSLTMVGVGLVLMASASTASAAGTHIANGGFEKPKVPVGGYTSFVDGERIGRWRVGGVGRVAVVSTTHTELGFAFPAKAGAQWLDLTGDGSNSAIGVSQTVATTPGVTYVLRFWVGNTVDPGGSLGTTSTVDVLIDGTLQLAATNSLGAGTSTLTWQRFTLKFEATVTSTQIEFFNGDGAGDNVNGLDAVALKAA